MKVFPILAMAAVVLSSVLRAQDEELDFGVDGKPPVALIVPEEDAEEPPATEEAMAEEIPPPAEPSEPPAQPPVAPPAPEPKALLPTVILGAPAEVPTEPGLTVRVEKSPSAETLGLAKDIKLASPFPPKPLAAIPAGWILRRPDDTKPFAHLVDLGGGNVVTVSITPFVLTPDDTQPSANVFSIREPGHKPALQYRQVDTVGALLTKSTQDLEDTDARMTEAIGRLNQLLLSFPRDSQ